MFLNVNAIILNLLQKKMKTIEYNIMFKFLLFQSQLVLCKSPLCSRTLQ